MRSATGRLPLQRVCTYWPGLEVSASATPCDPPPSVAAAVRRFSAHSSAASQQPGAPLAAAGGAASPQRLPPGLCLAAGGDRGRPAAPLAAAGLAARALSTAPPAPPPSPRGGGGGGGGGGALQEVAAPLPPANQGPWKRAKDERTGGSYWWNPTTQAATPVGAPKPDAWVAVRTPAGDTYYWNKSSGDTTAVGEPLPGPEGRLAPVQSGAPLGGGGRGSALFNLVTYPLAIGVGFGLFAGVLRMIF